MSSNLSTRYILTSLNFGEQSTPNAHKLEDDRNNELESADGTDPRRNYIHKTTSTNKKEMFRPQIQTEQFKEKCMENDA